MRKISVRYGVNAVQADQRGHEHKWPRLLTSDKKCNIQKKTSHVTSYFIFSPTTERVMVDA